MGSGTPEERARLFRACSRWPRQVHRVWKAKTRLARPKLEEQGRFLGEGRAGQEVIPKPKPLFEQLVSSMREMHYVREAGEGALHWRRGFVFFEWSFHFFLLEGASDSL